MSSSSRPFRPPFSKQGARLGLLWQLPVRFIATVLALHAPSWLSVWIFQVPRAEERPLFNLDLLLGAAVACFSSLGGALVLTAAWAADGLRAAAKNYHFMSTVDFVDAARFVDMLHLPALVSPSMLGALGGVAICMWLVLRLTRHARLLALPLVIVAVLAAGCDIVNGSFHWFGMDKDKRAVSLNFAGSPAWNVWAAERQSFPVSGPGTRIANPVTYRSLQSWQADRPGQSAVLILVESMGQPRAPALNRWLESRLMTPRLKARWDTRTAEELFSGSTTFGELRTLCGLHVHYSRLDEALASDCLPRQWAAKGVTSIGLHGFGLRMFDRSAWWPRIGLQPWNWRDSALPRSMNCNPAFPGVCDADVLAQAVALAQEPGRFVYALTLDTHLPLDFKRLPPLPDDLGEACAASETPLEACQLVRQLGDLLTRLEVLLAASGTTPFLVVVGDHAPPFSERLNRDAFAQDRVPLFIMKPR